MRAGADARVRAARARSRDRGCGVGRPSRGVVALLPALVLLAGAGAAAPAAAGVPALVTGKVSRWGDGVSGALVSAHRSSADALADRGAVAAGPSGADGGYRLELPAGSYYLVARKAEEAAAGAPLPVGAFFAYHGSNPFTLAAGARAEVHFSLARKTTAISVRAGEDPASGALSGIVTWEGRPVEGAHVKLYLDAASDFRGTGYASAPPTGADGAFRFDYLPGSEYFVVAARRAGGAGAGPIAAGDLYGFFLDNPVRVPEGGEVRIEFEIVGKGRDLPNADGRPRASGTSISGRIRDAAGAPVPGVYAFAYEERVMSHRKPAFLSQAGDAEGRYVIHLSRGGTFYIGARSAYGDSPMKGEWYGKYDGSPDHGVTVREGERLEGVDIVVERILP